MFRRWRSHSQATLCGVVVYHVLSAGLQLSYTLPAGTQPTRQHTLNTKTTDYNTTYILHQNKQKHADTRNTHTQWHTVTHNDTQNVCRPTMTCNNTQTHTDTRRQHADTHAHTTTTTVTTTHVHTHDKACVDKSPSTTRPQSLYQGVSLCV